jgi:hypothetical protein
MHNTTVIEEQDMVNQQSLDTNESSQEANAADVTEFVDPIQSDSHDPHIQIDTQHTMNEQPMRSRN